MNCPVCKNELVIWKRLHLETLNEHVCNPNGFPSLKNAFRCPAKSCDANFGILNSASEERLYEPRVIWNEDGDLYSFDRISDTDTISFINNNNAPFGSFQRQMNVEIYKKDENKLLFKFSCWPLKGWKVYSRYSYESNRNGDILERHLHFNWITNEGVWHTWGYRMLLFSLQRTWNDYKFGRCDSLKDSIKRGAWPRAEWWRKINAEVASLALKYSKRTTTTPTG